VAPICGAIAASKMMTCVIGPLAPMNFTNTTPE
jgi:hypothetical protein